MIVQYVYVLTCTLRISYIMAARVLSNLTMREQSINTTISTTIILCAIMYKAIYIHSIRNVYKIYFVYGFLCLVFTYVCTSPVLCGNGDTATCMHMWKWDPLTQFLA